MASEADDVPEGKARSLVRSWGDRLDGRLLEIDEGDVVG